MVVLDQGGVAETHPVVDPAATRTAYFCSARRPGSVLRVSRILAWVPSTAATQRGLRGDAAEVGHQVEHRPFGRQQSPGIGFDRQQRITGIQAGTVLDPSGDAVAVCAEHLVEHQKRRSTPAATPGSLVTIAAFVIASAGTVALVVTSGP